jgi:hypothetical protein
LGRYSPSKSYITIDCTTTPELHDRFYRLKKQVRSMFRRKRCGREFNSNREFLEFLLNLAEEKLAEESRRRVITSY